MSDKQETIADIIAEKRREANFIVQSAEAYAKAGETSVGTPYDECDLERDRGHADEIRREADRLEAAHRRELATLNLAVSSAHDALREVMEQNCSHCHKRELAAGGNAAKLREALMTIRKSLVAPYESELQFIRFSPDKPLVDLIDAALAESVKNCEVGTPTEQMERFNRFCVSHYKGPDEHGVIPSGCDCPCQGKDGCNAFVWSQMPYEEGGAK